MIRPTKSNRSLRYALTIALAVVFTSACGISIKYSYDTQAKFPELKTYMWVVPPGGREPEALLETHRDPLLEANVQLLADRNLGSKGWTRHADSADLLLWMDYDSEYGEHRNRYEVRMLTLNIARADNRELIWRGTAAGHISTDAASKTLDGVVTRILSSFPPK